MIAVGASVPDVDVESEGQTVSLADVAAGTALLIFEKESCPTCEIAMPIFTQWTVFAPDVRVVAVSQDDPETTARFFEAVGATMPVVYDRAPYEASAAFELDSVPSLTLIEDGVVSWTAEGWHRGRIDELGALLADRTGRVVVLEGVDDLPLLKPG